MSEDIVVGVYSSSGVCCASCELFSQWLKNAAVVKNVVVSRVKRGYVLNHIKGMIVGIVVILAYVKCLCNNWICRCISHHEFIV